MTAGSETFGAAVARLTRIFADAGIDSAALDARLLAAAAAGVSADRARSEPEMTLDGAALKRLDRMVHRRAAERMPVSRILGRREFWSLDFALSPATLDPRPDSETLVGAALALVADRIRAWRILDIGTGSGCLLLALLSERPAATGLGTDIDPAATKTAAANARTLGLADRAAFRTADWTDGIAETFDLVVSNPPYIPTGEIEALAPEVARHDPRMALDGGPDGLVAYRALALRLRPLLAPDGGAVLEIGHDQAAPVTRILAAAGLAVDAPVTDIAGRDRCLVCRAA